MTRHTWRPGGAIDPGATYYPMDGARQGDPLEPDDVIAALDAHMEHTGIVDAMAQEIENLRAELDGRAPVGPVDHWSSWLEWRGGPCPLPGDAIVSCRCEDGVSTRPGEEVAADQWDWSHAYGLGNILAFRYRADNPAGWLPRGDWIPPAELWDEGCPVRVEWVNKDLGNIVLTGPWRTEYDRPTHIRLVARQPQAGLPEGFEIANGNLIAPCGRVAFAAHEKDALVPAVIRQAVDAWLREMGDEE